MKNWFIDNKTKILWRLVQVFALLVINAATISFIVLNMIDVELPANFFSKEPTSISYYDLITTKAFSGSQGINIFGYTYHYHTYHKIILWVFMILGAIGSYGFIKLLYKNHREDRAIKKEVELKEKLSKEEKAANKEKEKLSKKIDKIMKG